MSGKKFRQIRRKALNKSYNNRVDLYKSFFAEIKLLPLPARLNIAFTIIKGNKRIKTNKIPNTTQVVV